MLCNCPPFLLAHQKGATLIVALVMLFVVMMLSTSFASVAIVGEKAARNERDKLIAMQAAEAALVDAEIDIENSTGTNSRSAIFSSESAEGFSQDCGKGDDNLYQGLCTSIELRQTISPIANSISNKMAEAAWVQFGRFTGKTLPHGGGPFPHRLPCYLIELVADNISGDASTTTHFYRITAVGFGVDRSTQIVLQSFYRKSI